MDDPQITKANESRTNHLQARRFSTSTLLHRRVQTRGQFKKGYFLNISMTLVRAYQKHSMLGCSKWGMPLAHAPWFAVASAQPIVPFWFPLKPIHSKHKHTHRQTETQTETQTHPPACPGCSCPAACRDRFLLDSCNMFHKELSPWF